MRSPAATAPGAVGGGAVERGEHLARVGDLVVGGRERLAQGVELGGVDRPLAVEAERARVHHAGAEGVVVARAEVRPVDRLDARGARGDEHALLGEAPVLRAAPPGRPSEAARSA